MTKINTGRALLGGLVAALIIDLIEGVINGVVLKADWAAAMQAIGKSGDVSAGAIVIYNIVGALEGIMGVWLYTALISRYGAGSITAAKAGLVVWALASVFPNMLWLPSGIISGSLMGYAVFADFLAIMLGVTMGALLYREEGVPLPHAARA
jgi:hypothetical protein